MVEGHVEPASPPDRTERQRVTDELASTLFVQAGAGSGKTRSLVERVVALVESGRAELRSIAAITFTEKAGEELRDRIRTRLGAVVAERRATPEASRCTAALEQLDGAAIGTLHAFAQRLLSEHALEAGLPPRFEVLDEVTSDVEFERRWTTFLDRLLEDGDLQRTLLLLFAAGVRSGGIRALARAFEDNWDLVEERVALEVPEPPEVTALLAPVLAELGELCREPCSDPSDRLRRRLDDIAEYAARLVETTDEVELLEALDLQSSTEPRPPSFRVSNCGRRSAFDDVGAVRARVIAAGEHLEDVRKCVGECCAKRLGSALRAFTLEAAEERRRSGRLQFHDLLVLARALLVDPERGAAVRHQLHRRYRHLLLDEFQDTDPIQVELAVRIAAADPESPEAGAAPWDEVAVAPGHLFFVGDPKQSIYRFRRADISTYLRASGRFSGDGAGVSLSANFRTAAPLIDWINATFDRLMNLPDDTPTPVPSQAPFVPLDATRSAPPVGPPVSVLGGVAHADDARADALRQREACDVAAAVASIVEDGWAVDDRRGGWRGARLGDVTVLVPARTSLPFLEEALEGRSIPYRAESSSLVYATRAVRDVLMVLRAVADPTNHLHLVSALRTPLLACGDDDLFAFRVLRRGRWSYLADQPENVPDDDPVRLGLSYLRTLYRERHWLSPSELFDRVVADCRALELGFAEGRPRDVWRRLRFVGDQARAWGDATGGNLRQYLDWVGMQAAEGARFSEVVLPETDDDAVRIMTVHAAKGLEFPIVVLSGMSTEPRRLQSSAEVGFPPGGGARYRIGRVTAGDYEQWRPVDEQMDFHERVRLLYVAATRARDHLVVSLHRKVRSNDRRPASRTNAELWAMACEGLLDALPDAAGEREGRPHASAPPAPPRAPVPFGEWQAALATALGSASRQGVVAATALGDEGGLDVEVEPDPGLEKRPRDLDLPPWLKGRYGTAVGRAVHGVLQVVDLATGRDLAPLVAAQCEAEAVGERAGDVTRLVGAALGAPSVQEAAKAAHWREVYVCTPVGDRLLEGYVDLLYRTSAGLVVVDYKTAATSDPDELDRRTRAYRNQGASYALALRAATGEHVARVTFVFLTPEGAVERHLADLDGSIAHAAELVRAGREVLAP